MDRAEGPSGVSLIRERARRSEHKYIYKLDRKATIRLHVGGRHEGFTVVSMKTCVAGIVHAESTIFRDATARISAATSRSSTRCW